MEGRLLAKLERASEASREAASQAKLKSESLEQLESRVDANENILMEALRESEIRILAKVQSQVEEIVQGKVKERVDKQLNAAGFDQDLSAADLSVRRSAMFPPNQTNCVSYVSAAAAVPNSVNDRLEQAEFVTKQQKHEDAFWHARRSLRLWPISGGSKEGLVAYLKDKLRLDGAFIEEELGETVITKPKEPRNKNKDEFIATFETKQIRDAVKAAATNLANHRDSAGMRLHVPGHLQRDFQALMNLSYDLKKRHIDLKRNIKYDEDDFGLFMDLRLKEGDDWKRVKPDQARAANKDRRRGTSKDLDSEDLRSLLGESSCGEEEEDTE